MLFDQIGLKASGLAAAINTRLGWNDTDEHTLGVAMAGTDCTHHSRHESSDVETNR